MDEKKNKEEFDLTELKEAHSAAPSDALYIVSSPDHKPAPKRISKDILLRDIKNSAISNKAHIDVQKLSSGEVSNEEFDRDWETM